MPLGVDLYTGVSIPLMTRWYQLDFENHDAAEFTFVVLQSLLYFIFGMVFPGTIAVGHILTRYAD